jgi:hypothetical protein
VKRSPDGGRIFSQSGFRRLLISGPWCASAKTMGFPEARGEPATRAALVKLSHTLKRGGADIQRNSMWKNV